MNSAAKEVAETVSGCRPKSGEQRIIRVIILPSVYFGDEIFVMSQHLCEPRKEE
ncbi:hypothetical protein QY049_04660 [Bradyrhizobium sp. WYCCWR 13022]|uniref:hypothetical protein n=1 Tax=unclassified Bradyrhizobium TaxID=2631580 RepID=UPI00263B2384|nr:hypothetical protein [Bradyrhizobium sp. WYCCWR 13022]MDN4982517.1 hypothetical protein [Bradyrhizobium sp. WYCCWR 13022]